jgi:hypothetical protein
MPLLLGLLFLLGHLLPVPLELLGLSVDILAIHRRYIDDCGHDCGQWGVLCGRTLGCLAIEQAAEPRIGEDRAEGVQRLLRDPLWNGRVCCRWYKILKLLDNSIRR